MTKPRGGECEAANHEVLISGAGIAGMATAYWLNRYGFRVTVVERAEAPRLGGYKIDVRGAAVEVLERMALLGRAREMTTDMQRTSFVDSSGAEVAAMDSDFAGGRAGADLEVMRGDLNRLLYEETRDTVDYLFGDSVGAISQNERGVLVTFEHGGTRRFDLVVGADGQHSNTRADVMGPESQFIEHLGHYVAIFSTANRLGLDRAEVIYPRPGRSTLVYRTREDAQARAMLLWASAPLGYDRRDVRRQRELIATEFGDENGWEVPRLLADVATAPDLYFDSMGLVRVPRWGHGRVVLVGDAAYGASPASGQGTSLALVGAYVLAGEVCSSPDDLGAAFARYQAAMATFVEKNQRLAASNLKGMVMRSRLRIWFQLRALKVLQHLPGKDRVLGRVAAAIHEAATGITLEDYPVDRMTRPQPTAPPITALPTSTQG
ncbi:MAG TPA: FAD-dependent oxidoreductase [Actinomycetales bacterium]|nr:FAD-dependent oxidoreductase [Actinomycetales bacterium]